MIIFFREQREQEGRGVSKIVESASTLRQQWDKAQGLEKDKLAEQLKTKIQMLDILRELHVLLGTLDY